MTDNPDEHFVEAATIPLAIQDFHITLEQAGAAQETIAPSGIQAEITQEFAAIMLRWQQNFRHGYEERQNRRSQMFETGRLRALTKRGNKTKKPTKSRTELSTMKSTGPETASTGPSNTVSPVDNSLTPMETTL